MTPDTAAALGRVLQLGFTNTISGLSANIQAKLDAYSNENAYNGSVSQQLTSTSALNTEYNNALVKINADYSTISTLINTAYNSEEIANLDSLVVKDTSVPAIFSNAKNNAQTGYTSVLNSYTRSNLTALLDSKKEYLLSRLVQRNAEVGNILSGKASATTTYDGLSQS